MTNLLIIAVVAILALQNLCGLKVKVSVVPRNRNTANRSRFAVGPLPCYEFFAYCKTAYNISRPNMTRMEGEKADAKSPQNLSSNKFLDHRCFCDVACRQYGDCCLDLMTDMDPNLTLQEFEDGITTKRTEGSREWECHTLPMTETDVYVIGSCPPSYDNAVIFNRCRRHVPRTEYDYTLDLPVYSKQSNLTYANVYCAICNGDKQLYRWDIQINCPAGHPNCTADKQVWRYAPGEKFWWYHSWANETRGVSLQKVTYEIQNLRLENQYYYQKFKARKCRKNVISNCPAGWSRAKEKMLCQSYSLIVKARNTSLLYKNEYCAICNGEIANHMLCPKVIREPPVVVAPPSPGIPSYALLLDFMGEGGQVGEAGICGTNGLVCGFGELCDPLHVKCRVYTCGRKYRMDDNGKCISANSSSDAYSMNSTDFPPLDNDCPKFYISRDRFIRHYNNSVYIKAMKKNYNSSQYEVVNSTTILVCTSPDSYFRWKFTMAQSILSRVCTTLSLVCLAAHIIIHIITPPLLNLPGKNLLCLAIALFIAQLSFEFGVGVTNSHELCVAISLIIHFGFLAAFFWMNVMAVDVYRTFGTASKTRSPGKNGVSWEFCIYSGYAWFMPFILVLMAFINDLTHWMPGLEPMYGSPLCWFNNRQGLLIYFALPLALLLITNIVFFSMTVNAICQTRKLTKIARSNSSADSNDVSRMLLYIKLALIMGLTWILGFVAAIADLEVIWYFFILLNCLQGTFIFVAFTCKKNVFRMTQKLTCGSACSVSQATAFKNASDYKARSSSRTQMTSVSWKLSSLDCPQSVNRKTAETSNQVKNVIKF